MAGRRGGARRFSDIDTVGGYKVGEVRSALQKDIRRGNEREALFWATELSFTGYGNYVWKTLRMIASEDIGLADNSIAVLVRALYENWVDQKKADDGREASANEFLVHAVMAMCRAPKSRIVDHAAHVTFENRELIPMPDYALDLHTARGREMGRGIEHFYEHGGKLEPESQLVRDTYREESLMLSRHQERVRNTKSKKKVVEELADAGVPGAETLLDDE